MWNPTNKAVCHLKCADLSTVEAKERATSETSTRQPQVQTFTRLSKPMANPYKPIKLTGGSDEQEAIWAYLLDGDMGHCVINAGPGTGKTHTMIQYCLRAPKSLSILFCAFNKHIATEAQGKLEASGCSNVTARTLHSVGNSMIRSLYPKTDVDDMKVWRIIKSVYPEPLSTDSFKTLEWKNFVKVLRDLTGHVKNYLIDYTANPDVLFARLEELVDRHAIDITTEQLRTATSLLPAILRKDIEQISTVIDYDDMIWLPVVLKLSPTEKYDVVIIDESQDLNAPQHEMLFLLPNPQSSRSRGGRIAVVGDRRQCIYSFRGSLHNSIDALSSRLGETALGVREFPLTITRRCPKSHVRLAANLFPDISALPDAPEGEIIETDRDSATAMMKVGDMVLCRINKELIRTAYSLIRRGVRPAIKGRDLGKSLLAFIDDLKTVMDKELIDQPSVGSEREITRFSRALNTYAVEQMEKLQELGDKAAGRMAALQDKFDCMSEFIANSSTISEIGSRIRQLFPENKEAGMENAVILGTIHRLKGLESDRVFVLCPELIPHPAAKQQWELEGEKNLAWVACTRAKFDVEKGDMGTGTLVFCGPVPEIYGYEDGVVGFAGISWDSPESQDSQVESRKDSRRLRSSVPEDEFDFHEGSY